MNYFALLLVANVAACTTLGDRAGSYNPDGGTTCPAGETCSSATPEGLSFGQLSATARGGTQTIQIDDARTGASLALPFAAQAVGSSFAVDSVTPPSLVVRGLAEGRDYLRILDVRTLQLFDRTAITVAEINSVSISSFDRTSPTAADDMLFAGDPSTITLDYRSARNWPLVDEEAHIDAHPAAAVATTSRGWNTIVVQPNVAGAMSLFATAASGSFFQALPIDVTDVVDSIELIPDPNGRQPLFSSFCFRMVRLGRTVHGRSWRFTTPDPSPVVLTPGSPEGGGIFAGPPPNCVRTFTATNDPFDLTASAGGRSVTVTIPAATATSGG